METENWMWSPNTRWRPRALGRAKAALRFFWVTAWAAFSWRAALHSAGLSTDQWRLGISMATASRISLWACRQVHLRAAAQGFPPEACFSRWARVTGPL